jgi:hypothetical protein
MHHAARGLVLAAAVLLARPSRAALGEPVESVARDQAALRAEARATTERGAFTVHELDAGGTTVREYVTPDGRVFAVAWSGLAHPDLHPLLGAYADDYQRAAEATPSPHGQRSQRVTGTDVVVERWGHMRDRHGRAYVPSLLPTGVHVDALQ